MLKAISVLSVAAGLTFAASAGQAMPLSADIDGNSSPHLTLVRGGCGLGWHRGPYGGCRPNVGPAVVVVGPVPYWRGPGWRFYGGCWRGPYGAVHCN
jgi:hypothetical protein